MVTMKVNIQFNLTEYFFYIYEVLLYISYINDKSNRLLWWKSFVVKFCGIIIELKNFREPPAIYKSSCTIDVEFFPFDEQLCMF